MGFPNRITLSNLASLVSPALLVITLNLSLPSLSEASPYMPAIQAGLEEHSKTADDGHLPDAYEKNHVLSPLENHYQQLENQLREIEQDNPLTNKLLTAGLVFALDMALELIHNWAIMNHSPDFTYGHPLSSGGGLEHSTRDIWMKTLSEGHVAAFLLSATSWLTANSSTLPALPQWEQLTQIGVLAGALAGGYRFFYKQALFAGVHGSITDTSFNPLLVQMEPSGRPWFTAISHFHTRKLLMQVASATVMVTWSFFRRFQNKATMHDVRNSLSMARDRLSRSYTQGGKGAGTFTDIPDLLREKLFEEKPLRQGM